MNKSEVDMADEEWARDGLAEWLETETGDDIIREVMRPTIGPQDLQALERKRSHYEQT